MKIKHFEKIAREQKAIEAASNEEQQQAQGEYQEGPQEQSQIADNQEQQSVEKLSESEEAKPNYMRTATVRAVNCEMPEDNLYDMSLKISHLTDYDSFFQSHGKTFLLHKVSFQIVGPIAQTATGFVVNVPQQPNIYGYY